MKQPLHIRRMVERLERLGKFEGVFFGKPGEHVLLQDDNEVKSVDELVRERTEAFRKAMLLPLVRELGKWANDEPKRRRGRPRKNPEAEATHEPETLPESKH